MAVVKVRRLFEESGQATADKGATKVSERHIYLVEFDTVATLQSAIGATDGSTTAPVLGQQLAGVQSFVKTIDLERLATTPKVIRLTANYESIDRDEEDEQTEGNRWNIEVSVKSVAVSETVYQDKDGDPIVNPAGQPYEPSLTKEFYDQEISITFDCLASAVNGSSIDDAIGMINESTTTMKIAGVTRTYPANTLKLTAGEYAPKNEKITVGDPPTLVDVWRVSLNFYFRRDGWPRKVLRQGLYELDGTDLVPILDANGEPVTKPRYLNAAGAVTDTPSFDTWEIEDTTSFATLLAGLLP